MAGILILFVFGLLVMCHWFSAMTDPKNGSLGARSIAYVWFGIGAIMFITLNISEFVNSVIVYLYAFIGVYLIYTILHEIYIEYRGETA